MYELHISKKEISKRMTYENIEGILAQYEKGKSVMIMTSHYGNWEWTLSFPLFMPNEWTSNPIYKKLNNKRFDRFIYSLRAKFGALLIEKKELLREMLKLKKENKLANFWMISDQSPNPNFIHYWTNFLNQDTPTLTGTEQLAKKFNYPVFYAEITRIKRGYYNCNFIPISMDPSNTTENEITNTYMLLLQKTIQKAPEYWLWTHRRWKYSR
jgi:KDO2-lipid IV(A) lauroyltransferase